jgi:Flp pilus assembly protein TadG
MFRSSKKFLSNTRGAFALQFAMMAIPLTVCAGLAIDGGRAFLARFELAAALDAAALAVGSTLTEGSDLDAIAERFVERNFRTHHDDPITLELVEGLVNGAETWTLKGQVTINTYFMPLVGQPYVTVSAESEVRQGGNNVEVALALDITGSMNATRMTGLRSAANLLIDEVVSEQQPPEVPFFSRAAIVPWSQYISLNTIGTGGISFVNNTVVEELRGTPTGPTAITAASWRAPSTSDRTISQAGWRVGTGKAISDVSWRRGAALNITNIRKTNSNTRIRVTVSAAASTYYANGDTVYISGANGSYTGLNGNRYKVADRTATSPYYIWLQNLGTTTYTTPPTGTTNATAGSSQRCWTTTCEVGVTANSHGYAAGDLVYINGVNTTGAGSSPNNTWGTTYTIGAFDANTFILPGTNSSSFATYNNNGTASKCYVANCRYRITTSTNHGFSTSDHVAIWGMTQSGSNTSAHSVLNSSWQVENPLGTVFFLPGDGRDYRDWTSGGTAAACEFTTCNVRITSVGHGIAVGERIVVTGAGGMTGLNTCSLSSSGTCSSGSRLTWTVLADNDANDSSLTLADSGPTVASMATNYTANSAGAQCTRYGCDRYWYLTSGNAERVFRPSPCMVERYGADEFTDANPATAPLGILYTGNGTCTQTNYVTPLTDNRQRLFDAVEDLDTDGSTAGQLGVAWGWYLLSNNFSTVWDREPENVPRPKNFSQLARVLVLMTDGEFNYSTCNGIASSGISSTLCTPSIAGDNTVGRDPSFKQAQALCNALRADGVIIYTVGLQLNTAGFSDDFLLACAGNPRNAFLAANNEELEAAFRNIATAINRLRIAR